MLRRALQHTHILIALLALACLLRPATPVRAAAYSYNPQQRVVNAGILLTDINGTNNTVPYVFYVLNQRNDIKPIGWSTINPLAPKTADSAVQSRWDIRTNQALGNHAYQLGQQVTQAMGPYWEVPLSSTSFNSLLQFDILYLPVNAATRFPAADMEKLRRYVDAGGQLWVEDTGGGSILADPTAAPNFGPLFFDVQFHNSGYQPGTAGYASLPVSGGTPVRHPILTTPYFLTNQDLSALGNQLTGATPQTPNFISDSTSVTLDPAPSLLTSVLVNSGSSRPLISAGQLGAGQIIVTDLGVGDAINNYVGSPNTATPGYGPAGFRNAGPYCGNALYAADTRDLRFLVDLLSWSESHPSERKNSRQSGASPNAPSASFAASWLYNPLRIAPTTPPFPPAPSAAGSISNPLPGAALYGGMVYARDANGILHAFNATPGTDLSGSGNPDNGILNATFNFRADYSQGQSYDELWQAFSNATTVLPADLYASAPTVATFKLFPASVSSTTQVLMEDNNGKVNAFDAATGLLVNTYAPPPSIVTGSYSSIGLPAPAPTYYDGRIYAGQPDGSLYVYDTNGANPANTPSPPGIVYRPAGGMSGEYVSAPPTVGIINENNANGINALVVTNKRAYSLFLGARGELLRDTSPPAENSHTSKLNDLLPSARMFTTPVGTSGLAVPRAYMTLTGGYPQVETPPTSATGVAPSSVSPFFPDSILPPAVYPPGHTSFDPLTADYDVDFNFASTSATPAGDGMLMRMTVIEGPNTAISAPAMDRSGNYYFAGGSSLTCFQDNINTYNAKLVWRYRLPYENDGTAGVFTDADGVIYDKNPLNPPYPQNPRNYTLSGDSTVGTNYQFVGAPVVDDKGNVYAVASNGTYAAVLCFAADPNGSISTDVFDASSTQAQGGLSNVVVTQNDSSGTPQTVNNAHFSTNGSGHITFNNFASVGFHTLTPDLTEPQPVTVRYNGNTQQGQGSQTAPNRPLHTNLRWYMILPLPADPTTPGSLMRSVVPSAPTLIGNYLFFGATETYGSGPTTAGVLYKVGTFPQSIGATVKPNPPATVNPIYYPKAVAVVFNNPPSLSEDIPLNVDGQPMIATSIADINVAGRLIPTIVSTPLTTGLSSITAVPSAGNGVMALNGANGISAFATQLTLVADNNRLLEADADGNAVWSVDSTKKMTLEGDIYYPGQTNPSTAQPSTGQLVTTHLELNRPTSVFQLTPNDYLVADTGNNRCVRFDRGGTVLWELTKFNDQSSGAPVYYNNVTSAATVKTGSLLNPGESLTLNQPTSVQTYRNYYRYGSSGAVYTIIHYLVADSGNYRVLDIVDVFDQNGQPVGPAHNLVWVSHTYDAQQRSYRYQGANFYVGADGKYYIAALVTNKRIADLPPHPYATLPAVGPLDALNSASADAPGGSIVLLDYDPAGAYPAAQKDGYINIYSSPDPAPATTSSYHLAAVSSFTYSGQTKQLSNPRFLSAYTTAVTTAGVTTYPKNFLYADDNGAFDLSPTGIGAAFTATWGFLPADYSAMNTSVVLGGPPFIRTALPFVASAVQKIAANDYLITQSSSQGEANSADGSTGHPPKIGGEVFEVKGATSPYTTGFFGNHTLSRPGNTGPLVQPTFAVRAK